MKNSLEDLLKQVYEQKEVPSQEFCQAVLREMKKRERKASFWNRDVIYQKGILVTTCIGIIVLIGLGMIHWQERRWNRGTSFKQDIAEHENPTPAVTDDSAGVKNRVETGELVDEENPADLGNEVETGNPADPEKEVETEDSKDMENEVGTDRIPGDGQKRRKDPDSSPSGKTALILGMPGRNPTAKPEEQNMGLSETDADSGNQKPQIMETARPAETVKPSKPSGTLPPQNTARPQENYISLCSIETYSFSMGYHPSGTDEVDEMDEIIVFPDSFFSDRLILSYEKLQSLIQELEDSLVWKKDDSIQDFLEQLKRYDENYFASNVLCISMLSLHEGTDLSLRAVWVRDMGKGEYCLDIWLDKVGNKTDQSSDIRYYSSVVCVPREIAGQCSMVQFQYSDRE